MKSVSRLFVFLIALVVGGGCVWWWLERSDTRVGPRSEVSGPPLTAAAREGDEPLNSVRAARVVSRDGDGETVTISVGEEETVGELIGDQSLSDEGVALRLKAIVQNPKRELQEREDALGHWLNLTVGEAEPAILALAADSALPDAFRDQLLTDSFNRGLRLQAELCLVLLERAGSELREQAREHLVFLLDADHGADVRAWRASVLKAAEQLGEL